MKVVIFGLHADLDLTLLLKSNSGCLWTVLGDVTAKAGKIKAIEICAKEMGGIDNLVYCAGVIGPVERADKGNVEEVKKSYDPVLATLQTLPSTKVSYRSPPANSKAALTRFIGMLAHEEPTCRWILLRASSRGLWQTMRFFRLWNEIGEAMVEPASYGRVIYYDEHVPGAKLLTELSMKPPTNTVEFYWADSSAHIAMFASNLRNIIASS
ncbi:uncharacterized protein BDR25DRAFT_352081 [Lindgomyces ingoldianus]|uniref:Uncharacterized protein n=1 Tax=Lindgomyces ingoldianus TaxID=673940 RepID=A0ACB6R2V5_9PLEO|nr:uncharacterized protein BDR25DRAFT_352081 [Lindgomyces ingoldianus]KAF2473589.1 hypothetical protein BDR25DRAFT_352081 [Lindgomyces ingoldianus]